MTFFYDINKKLQQVLETPKSVHQNLNESAECATTEASTGDYSAKKARAGKDIGKPGKNFEKIAKSAGEKYGSKERGEKVAGAVLNKLRGKNESVEEGIGDVVRKGVDIAKKVGSKALDTLGHGSDEDMIRLAQKRAGVPQTGIKPRTPLAKEAAAPMTPKQKSFAKLAPPADKITFADKIAGAKQEVDEVLGDVAAEAMKSAVAKTRKIAGKRYGGSAQKDDEPQATPAAPRGRGRPKKPTDTEQGADLKPDWSAFGIGKVKLPAHKGAVTKHTLSDKEPSKVKEAASEDDLAVLKRLMDEAFAEGKNSLGNEIQGIIEKLGGGEEELEEKAVSKKQQKFMGMVHAAQKGEKPASKEVAKVAKTMKKKDAEDFAATKHKGLPEKAPKKKDEAADKSAEKPKKSKKEKTEEAGGTGTPTASSGFGFGKGIYDSLNRELENMISESMNVSINMSNDAQGGPAKSVTVTATDEDAETLSALLQNAGLGGQGADEHGAEACPSCGQAPCGCAEVVDENQPDWPTDEVTSDDALQYSGGINKPKTDVAGDGQTTVPVAAVHTQEEDALRRMMEMAGIKEEAKPDYIDLDKDGDKEESMKKAAKDKEEKKVEESIFSLTNLWKAYKG